MKFLTIYFEIYCTNYKSLKHILGEYIYGPSSNEAAATIAQLTKSFCREYKINQDAIVEGKHKRDITEHASRVLCSYTHIQKPEG